MSNSRNYSSYHEYYDNPEKIVKKYCTGCKKQIPDKVNNIIHKLDNLIIQLDHFLLSPRQFCIEYDILRKQLLKEFNE